MADDYTRSSYLTRYFLQIGNPLSKEVNVLNARSDKPTRRQALPDQAGGTGPNDGQITAHTMQGGS
jgi:hypothetical protein